MLLLLLLQFFSPVPFFFFVGNTRIAVAVAVVVRKCNTTKNPSDFAQIFYAVVVKVYLCCSFDFNCRNTSLHFCSIGLDLKCLFLRCCCCWTKFAIHLFFVFLFISSGGARLNEGFPFVS